MQPLQGLGLQGFFFFLIVQEIPVTFTLGLYGTTGSRSERAPFNHLTK